MIKCGLLASTLLATGLASNAMAQFVDADTGCGDVGEANGGCNFGAPPASNFQNLGSFGIGSFSINGSCGTFDPESDGTFNNRDLDWYSFTLNQNSKVVFVHTGGTPALFAYNRALADGISPRRNWN